MKTLNRVWIALAFLSAQGCATYEPRFNISSVVPQRVSPTYIVDNPQLWPDVAPFWKTPTNLLALRVFTDEKIDFGGLSSGVNVPETVIYVSDCSGKIGLIYQPRPRFIGVTPSEQFEYEQLIEYKRNIPESDPTYYDIFDDGTDLCVVIKTIKMGFRGEGRIYRIEASKYKKLL